MTFTTVLVGAIVCALVGCGSEKQEQVQGERLRGQVPRDHANPSPEDEAAEARLGAAVREKEEAEMRAIAEQTLKFRGLPRFLDLEAPDLLPVPRSFRRAWEAPPLGLKQQRPMGFGLSDLEDQM